MQLSLCVAAALLCFEYATVQCSRENTVLSTNLDTTECEQNVTFDYHMAEFNFATELYKRIAARTSDHFVISILSTWLTLAALSEGGEGAATDELRRVLGEPKEECLRRRYQQLAAEASSSFTPAASASHGVVHRSRYLVLDQSLALNQSWADAVRRAGLLKVTTAELRDSDARAVKTFSERFGVKLPENFTGNSIIIDTLDYEASWTEKFPDSYVEYDAPFYDDNGTQIGTVDLSRIKTKIRVAHLPLLNAKVLELPAGKDDQYRLLILITLGNNTIRNFIQAFTNSVVKDVRETLRESSIPLEVAIPHIALTTYIENMRDILEEIGVRSLWTDEAATKYVSSPAAAPAALLQRVRVTLGTGGVGLRPDPTPTSAPTPMPAEQDTGLPPAVGRDFIVNRSFAFALLDAKTYSSIFAGPIIKLPFRN